MGLRASVVDPRTGEILKGNVTLDSQRARQDVLLASGLDPQHAGACGMAAGPDSSYLVDPADRASAESMALARIRQLSAHEVGHAIGLNHNFAASTRDRASVMDYPAPRVRIVDGRVDLSDAYANGIGAYDKTAISYGYRQFPAGANDKSELDRLVSDAIAGGMRYLADDEARPAGAADPRASLWDNGDDAVANLRHELRVRRLAIERFGTTNIADGQALSQLEAVFLPLYFHHRYHLQAAVKTVGGAHFSFSVRKDAKVSPETPIEVISPERQREALASSARRPGASRARGSGAHRRACSASRVGTDSVVREAFPKRTDPFFDPSGAASIAADMVVRGLLEPHRAARVVAFHARDARQPSLDEVIEAIVGRAFSSEPRETANRALVRIEVQRVVVDGLMRLSGDVSASPAVRAIATDGLRRLSQRLGVRRAPTYEAFRRMLRDDIERFLSRPFEPQKPTERLPVPQGDPIGGS
ncbi:MAG: zinc-dependent metalloprotease [Blastocatellia bacterium]|nr:zinc-dependent metalloprotease [Blastocatellia bacterium]